MELRTTHETLGSDSRGQSSATPAIVARNLTKRYGQILAVNDLSFEVPWGAVTGFLGPNGAGKTTTMRMVLGLVKPSRGTAQIAGRHFVDLRSPSREVGALLDASAVHPGRTGRNQLGIVAAQAGIPGGRVDEVLEMVELSGPARRRIGGYSMGMRQRLGLAGALLGSPRILVLDEPANGLDPAGINWLRGFLRSFVEQGNAAFVSSHLLAEMAQLADEVVVIARGRLVTLGSLADLTSARSSSVQVRTPEPDRLRAALEKAGTSATRLGVDQVVVTGSTPETVGDIAAREGVVLYGLEVQKETLEHVFLELTGQGRGASTHGVQRVRRERSDR
jgi:ABC-2 type transport system ATP-binding protein